MALSEPCPQRRRRGLVCCCCALCCREMIVPVNDGDLRRLVAISGLSADRMVGFYGPRHVEYDGRSGLWFRTRYGMRVMALKRVGGKCRFLSSDNRCRVYSARPSTCRTFPYEIAYRGPLQRPVMTKTTWPLCRARPAVVAYPDDVLRAHRREMREDRRYQRRLRIWETTGNGRTADLLVFLGF